MLELENVQKRYAEIHAVRGISLTIPRGQVAGLLGPNGAGKSTTIRMILGSVPPTSGRIRVDGLDSFEHSRRVRALLGYLPEANPLYPEMSVREYLAYRTHLFALRGARARGAVERAMETCGLTGVRAQPIGTLSKGFRQRVGLGAAIVHDPKVIILDEPTSGLDPAQIAEMRTVIRNLAARATILLVSHMLPEVELACDRVIILAAGRVLADGTPADLLRNAARACIVEARHGFASAPAPTIAGATIARSESLEDGWRRFLIESANGEPGADPREEIGRAFVNAGWLLRELRPQIPTLEALYLDLLGGRRSERSAA